MFDIDCVYAKRLYIEQMLRVCYCIRYYTSESIYDEECDIESLCK